jgi:hypothetical protein
VQRVIRLTVQLLDGSRYLWVRRSSERGCAAHLWQLLQLLLQWPGVHVGSGHTQLAAATTESLHHCTLHD